MERVVWCVSAETRLDWKQWGEDFVLFHENSGNTHYLNLFAATALKLLLEGPATAESLARNTAARISVPYEAYLLDSVNVMLSEFKSLGITKAAAT